MKKNILILIYILKTMYGQAAEIEIPDDNMLTISCTQYDSNLDKFLTRKDISIFKLKELIIEVKNYIKVLEKSLPKNEQGDKSLERQKIFSKLNRMELVIQYYQTCIEKAYKKFYRSKYIETLNNLNNLNTVLKQLQNLDVNAQDEEIPSPFEEVKHPDTLD